MPLEFDPERLKKMSEQRLADAMHYLVAHAPDQTIKISAEDYNRWRETLPIEARLTLMIDSNSDMTLTISEGEEVIPPTMMGLDLRDLWQQ